MFRSVCRGNVRFTSFHRFCSSSPQSTESLTYKLSKILSLQGVCSRREAEKLIESGKVKVNNKVVNNIGTRLVPFGCNIAVQEKPLPPFHAYEWKPKLWLHYKMPQVLISHKDDRGRTTLFPILQRMLAKDPDAKHLVSVGRLDYMSEGLLLITNNGELARHMELPENEYVRKYIVRIHGNITDTKLKAIRHGVKIDGIHYAGMDFNVISSKTTNHMVEVSLREGKNRELRTVFAHFNWQVSKLKRIQYGPYKLGDIPKGGLLEVQLKGNLLDWYQKQRDMLIRQEILTTHPS